MRNVRRNSGFTLIELLLVLVILGILAAVVVPKFTGRSEQAKVAATKTDLAVLDGALDQFEQDCGRYPTSEEGLAALLSAPANLTGWHGPYIKRADLPKDQWGNPYQYRSPGSKNTTGIDIFSFGPDGREGTDDLWPNQ